MYKLYSIAGTCSTGITVLLNKLGVDFEVIQRDDVPNYKDLVPTGSVPALQLDNGTIITEGAAIALFLMEKHGKDILPDTPEARAEFYRWLMFNYATLHPAYSKLFTIGFKVEMDENERAKVMRQLADQISALWSILDTRLQQQPFIFGDTPTVLDYLVTVYSSWNSKFPNVAIKLGPKVEALITAVAALPEFKAAYTQEHVEFKAAA